MTRKRRRFSVRLGMKVVLAVALTAVTGLVVISQNTAQAAADIGYFNVDQQTELRSNLGGKCLDIKSEDGLNNNNARAQLYHCTGVREQKFSFAFAGSSGGQNLFFITTTGTNKCLQVRGGDFADGTQVDQLTCGHQLEQRWWLQSMGDGSYALHNLVGGCLDVSGGSSNDGTKIQKWTCNGSAAQRWRGGSGNPHACTDAYTTPQTTPLCPYDHLTRSVHARTNVSLCVAAPEGQAAQSGVQLFQGKCVYSDKFWTFRYLGLFNNTVYYAMQNSNGGLCLGATALRVKIR